jgi:hypothetical protein
VALKRKLEEVEEVALSAEEKVGRALVCVQETHSSLGNARLPCDRGSG